MEVRVTSRDLIQIRAHILCAWHAIQDPYASNQLDEACAIINEALRHVGEQPADSDTPREAVCEHEWRPSADGSVCAKCQESDRLSEGIPTKDGGRCFPELGSQSEVKTVSRFVRFSAEELARLSDCIFIANQHESERTGQPMSQTTQDMHTDLIGEIERRGVKRSRSNRLAAFTNDELCAIDDALSAWLLERQAPDVAIQKLSDHIRIELGRRT